MPKASGMMSVLSGARAGSNRSSMPSAPYSITVIEGINSQVQAAKAKARGYRSTRNLKAIIYLLAGKLDLRLPA
jgi:hypothetical protein